MTFTSFPILCICTFIFISSSLFFLDLFFSLPSSLFYFYASHDSLLLCFSFLFLHTFPICSLVVFHIRTEVTDIIMRCEGGFTFLCDPMYLESQWNRNIQRCVCVLCLLFLNACINICTTICILLLTRERIISTSSSSQRIRNKCIGKFVDVWVCNYPPVILKEER